MDVVKELVITRNLNKVKQFRIEYHELIKIPIFGSFLRMFELENFRYKIRDSGSNRRFKRILFIFIRKIQVTEKNKNYLGNGAMG